MKKLSTICVLAIALASCKKDVNVQPQEIKETTAEAPTVINAKTTTVTSESALKSAVSAAKGGDVITISGTIKLTATLKLTSNGSSSARITLTGGTLDCSGIPSAGRGVSLTGSYWTISNMTVKKAPDNGIVVQTGGYNRITNVTTTGNGDTGIQIYNGAHDNLVSNCYSSENYDAANGGENADGYACKLSSGKNNVFDKCTAYHNSDDGWDLYDNPYSVKITNCTASKNGWGTNGDGNGFKLGSAGQNLPHTVTNCNSINNKKHGYDGNGNVGHITLTGSTGSGNGGLLFSRIY